ncbi:unnamed protein product [Linum trigynum]|uniref:Uncharacterized protein n=1 Tax=Linum trigynum TaxID=586398 RepID=A0AAV2D4S1_9ROSI
MVFNVEACCAMVEQMTATCQNMVARMDALEQLLAGFIPERVTVIDGKRSDDDVARVDANEVRAAEKMEISDNNIDGKETVRNGDYHLCEALTQRSGSDGKETLRRGDYHLDEALTYRFRSCEKVESAVRVQSKRNKTIVLNEHSTGSFEWTPSLQRLGVERVELDDIPTDARTDRVRTRRWKFRKRPTTQRRRKSCCCFRRRPPRLVMDRTLETKVP